MLDGDAYADAVRADERRGAALGVSGVPFYVIDEQYGVSGAQPASVLPYGSGRSYFDVAVPKRYLRDVVRI